MRKLAIAWILSASTLVCPAQAETSDLRCYRASDGATLLVRLNYNRQTMSIFFMDQAGNFKDSGRNNWPARFTASHITANGIGDVWTINKSTGGLRIDCGNTGCPTFYECEVMKREPDKVK
jgi:hypothetical protein